ncbi:MAG: electron transport complex subunit RsxC [Phycisphaerae bacterium]|nr:electron transport complex subunit RsxC [Phycisphaerae bacterium]
MTEALQCMAVELEAGATVVVPMSQHIGAPCKPVVEKGQEVTVGQVVGESEAFVSAPVHSPVNGVVAKIADMPHPNGSKVQSVVITVGQGGHKTSQWQKLPDKFELDKYEYEQIEKAVNAAGIVGMGGAAFPTAVKLARNPQKPVTTVLLNGCECEPYLTSDHRLMLEAADSIVAGLALVVKATGASKGVIGIEDNKPDAIEVMLKAIEGYDNLQIASCKTKYPQGAERQLVNALTKRVVPTGGLPLDVGVVVCNVGTAAAIAWAVTQGRALTERIVTLTGKGLNNPGNFVVPVGMLLSDLIEFSGGLNDEAEKVLLGGPMMGPTTSRLDIPILKGTSGITVMTAAEYLKAEPTACIRCSRCVDVCPLNLVPTKIAHAVKARNIEMAKENDIMACCDCGCCVFICPSQIPLLQYIRTGKIAVRQMG